MLSNPNSRLHQRQRQHRRQNSTPTAFQAPKVPLLPASTLQRNGSHRRGQSYDQQSNQRQTRQHWPQDDTTVSTNPGLQQRQQHILREAQQQRLARPGHLQPRSDFPLEPQLEEPPPDYFEACFSSTGGLSNHSPSHTQPNQQPNFSPTRASGSPVRGRGIDVTPYSTHDSNPAAGYLDGFGPELDGNARFVQNNTAAAFVQERQVCSTPQEEDDAGIWSRSVEHPAHAQRPTTPQNQTNIGSYPLTPDGTPYGRVPQTEPCRRTRSFVSPSSKDETIKPSRARTLMQAGDIFSDMHHDEHGNPMPSPPNTAPLALSGTFELAPMPNPNFMSMSSLNMNLSGSDNGYDSSYYSPLSAALSPSQSSFLSSPEMEQMQLFGNPLETMPDLTNPAGTTLLPASQSSVELSGATSPVKGQMPLRAMSVADLNLDASLKDTGITLDDISTFIEGPDPLDGKWICLFPECNKKFGRKENIKSHVQTHLGDRQYRCNHCKKCFVRQHDLKRHAKIHSGVKPYPCLCGNSFARHDALTRHRQRGMCIGAFEGVVKKVVKRGRPRKHRPDAEERQDKASRTRKKATAMSQSSSTSGMSEHSYYQSSPPGSEDSLSSRSMSPFELLTEGFQPDQTEGQANTHQTPPMSPDSGTGAGISPQAIQQQPASEQGAVTSLMHQPEANNADELLPPPAMLSSPGKSPSSQFNTPPGLCLSSSSPPSSKFFDLESTSGPSGPEMTNSRDLGDFGLPDITEQVDEMFLDFSNTDNGMTALEKNPNMLLLDKFDNTFGGDDLFGEQGGSDMLF